jgi:hypothetical protein
MLSLLCVIAGCGVCTDGARAEGMPQTLGEPFGEHDGLQLADDSAGATAFTWRTTTGEGQRIDFAEIPPGGQEASAAEAVIASASHSVSEPELAVAPSGRVAVAWFEQRETEQVSDEDVIAVDVREREPDGSWGPVTVVWRAPAKPVYGYSGHLAVAVDDAGDVAVMWEIGPKVEANRQPAQLMTASRARDAQFTPAATLAPAEAQPQLALNGQGEITALWASPWQSETQQLDTQTWRAGGAPTGSPALLDTIGPAEAAGFGYRFSELSLQTAASGSELAVWLKGRKGELSRPYPVALRYAWREPGQAFGAPQTLTSPGVEARQPSLSLSSQNRALVAWEAIDADGSGPLLYYGSGSPGESLEAHGPFVATLEPHGLESALFVTWLPANRVLIGWSAGATELADELAPGTPITPGVPIRRRQSEFEESLAITGAEGGRPVLAWIGASRSDFSSGAVRYVVGANLPAFAGPPSASASLFGGRDIVAAGVSVNVTCPESCAVTVGGHAYALRPEDRENAAASAYTNLGALPAITRSLGGSRSNTLRLTMPRHIQALFCRTVKRGDNEAVEVSVTTRSARAGERHLILGEEPTSIGCGRFTRRRPTARRTHR